MSEKLGLQQSTTLSGGVVTTVRRSWRSYFCALFFGDPHGEETKPELIQEWEHLSLLAALLLGVSAGGLFTAPSLEWKGGGAASSAPTPWPSNETTFEYNTTTKAGRMLEMLSYAPTEDEFDWTKQWATIVFCFSTFCYLSSCISAAFFVQFARSTKGDAEAVRCVLGWAERVPALYFRMGCAQNGLDPPRLARGQATDQLLARDHNAGGTVLTLRPTIDPRLILQTSRWWRALLSSSTCRWASCRCARIHGSRTARTPTAKYAHSH
jgi:hypothetical protein